MDVAAKLREAAAAIDLDGTSSQAGPTPLELMQMAEEVERMRRQRDDLLSYINGISRQTAEMVRANS
jgi:ubiquinone biosynthesis protein UbiJ